MWFTPFDVPSRSERVPVILRLYRHVVASVSLFSFFSASNSCFFLYTCTVQWVLVYLQDGQPSPQSNSRTSSSPQIKTLYLLGSHSFPVHASRWSHDGNFYQRSCGRGGFSYVARVIAHCFISFGGKNQSFFCKGGGPDWRGDERRQDCHPASLPYRGGWKTLLYGVTRHSLSLIFTPPRPPA